MKNTLQDFYPKIHKTSNCWLWIGNINYAGYGEFNYQNKTWRAHRMAYELFKGKIPNGKQLDHLCRVRHCVNPDHLEPVTTYENIMRGMAPSAQAARRGNCEKGHPYTIENTRYYRYKTRGRGCRICRQCHRDNQNRRNAELRILDKSI